MKARFDELLPFYVNGTLSDTDRAWVDDYLGQHPQAAAELHWYQSLQARLRDDVPAVSSEVGLERAMQRIRSEGPAPLARKAPAGPPMLQRLRGFFGSMVPQPVLRPALAGAVAVVAVQALVIGSLVGVRDESTGLRAVQGSVVEKGPYLKINFKADAREADIRLLLVEVRGSLAGGPGQLGDWFVRVPETEVAAATAALKASAIVDAVALVDGLPARP